MYLLRYAINAIIMVLCRSSICYGKERYKFTVFEIIYFNFFFFLNVSMSEIENRKTCPGVEYTQIYAAVDVFLVQSLQILMNTKLKCEFLKGVGNLGVNFFFFFFLIDQDRSFQLVNVQNQNILINEHPCSYSVSSL